VVSVLRENPRFKDTPVIFITGLCQGEERSEGGSPSNVCVLAKPLDSDELIEKVNSLLQAT
ncbi:MAG: DNA-binding response regulator, partial [Candidatus Omnitrophica bacterium]|nr:DNA-binding response regulator [Candidatus Omnitrophota bacterium]